jgi:hypothetical protein
MSALDFSTADMLRLALTAETAARASLADAGILGACSERSTLRATTRVLDESRDFVAIARLLATLGQHWDVIEPVLAALAAGDRVEIEEAAPVRARGDERPTLAVVNR